MKITIKAEGKPECGKTFTLDVVDKFLYAIGFRMIDSRITDGTKPHTTSEIRSYERPEDYLVTIGVLEDG